MRAQRGPRSTPGHCPIRRELARAATRPGLPETTGPVLLCSTPQGTSRSKRGEARLRQSLGGIRAGRPSACGRPSVRLYQAAERRHGSPAYEDYKTGLRPPGRGFSGHQQTTNWHRQQWAGFSATARRKKKKEKKDRKEQTSLRAAPRDESPFREQREQAPRPQRIGVASVIGRQAACGRFDWADERRLSINVPLLFQIFPQQAYPVWHPLVCRRDRLIDGHNDELLGEGSASGPEAGQVQAQGEGQGVCPSKGSSSSSRAAAAANTARARAALSQAAASAPRYKKTTAGDSSLSFVCVYYMSPFRRSNTAGLSSSSRPLVHTASHLPSLSFSHHQRPTPSRTCC